MTSDWKGEEGSAQSQPLEGRGSLPALSPSSEPSGSGETHIDRECQLLGHEFALEPDAEDGDPMTCIHCGAEYAGR